MIGDSPRVLRLLPPLKTGSHDIAEILLKVVLNTKNQKSNQMGQANYKEDCARMVV